MTRDERLARYRTELGAIEGSELGYVVFSDGDHPDRVVQVTAEGETSALIEATPNYDGELARLTPQQRLDLAALGYDVTVEPYPQRVVAGGLGEAVDLLEPSFVALGAAPDFVPVLVAAENDTRAWADPPRSP